jgi:hypothetical protein
MRHYINILSIVTALLSGLIACGGGDHAVAAWIEATGGGLKIYTSRFLVSDDDKTCPSLFS